VFYLFIFYLQLTQIKVTRPYYYSGSWFFFSNQEKCTKCLYIGKNPLFQLQYFFLSKMCVKCRIWLKKYKIFLGRGNNPPRGPRHFHLGYWFLIWASSLKISVAQLAIMYKKLIWDPVVVHRSSETSTLGSDLMIDSKILWSILISDSLCWKNICLTLSFVFILTRGVSTENSAYSKH
jgi:hypothetical protein